MTSMYDTYTSPLASRNASAEMLRVWSPRHKFQTWRRIWLAVAEAQHEMGLPVTREQVEELRANLEVTDEDMRAAEGYERKLRHDVMAHVHAWGDRCPRAKGIIHLGMTSQDVNDNAELLIFREAVKVIGSKVARCLQGLTTFADRWKSVPTLGFTHYQPAQPVTVGRRGAQWACDLHSAWVEPVLGMRGLRGATGTQASYLALLDNDTDRLDQMEASILESLLWGEREWAAKAHRRHQQEIERTAESANRSNRAGDPNAADAHRREHAALAAKSDTQVLRDSARLLIDAHTYRLVSQTYPRVVDAHILHSLAATASVLHKIATDIRLLSNRKELDEPFEEKQIGSSAMPYKRNPMRCERICGLTRFVMNLVGNAYDTAATQWLERTLDDSSNRRLSLPEAFLALDGALDLMHNVASGLIVHEAMVRKNLMAELPFMATENLLMACVKAGGDRQEYHELIRQHAQAAGLRVKQEGLDNDLLERLKADAAFHVPRLKSELDWDGLMDPMKYIGRSVEQTERFLKEVVEPLREQYGEEIAKLGESGPKV